MAIDGRLLARAREHLKTLREENENRREALEREIYRTIPEVQQIDMALRALVSEVVAVTASNGNGKEQLNIIEQKCTDLCAQKAELLVAHGYPSDALDGKYHCQRCHDTGYLKDGSMCSCLRDLYNAEQKRELSQLSEAGERGFSAVSLDYYSGDDRENMENNLSVCRTYVSTFGKDSLNLLFQGDTGLGKTLLSRIIASAVSEAGFSVVYETAQNAFAAFEDQKFSRDAEAYATASERVRRILGCDLLVLDDLGTELTTSFTQSALYNIVDTRLNSGKKTIISTNLEDKELQQRYLAQIVSRLNGEYATLFFRGRDIRAQKKEKRYL